MIFKTRYFIIPNILLNGVGTNLIKIKFKIPEEFVLVDGAYIHSGRNGVGVKPSGCVSLSFNSRASNPIRVRFKDDPFNAKKRKYEFIKLKEVASGGTYIDGFIELAGNAQVGQFVNIIIKGKKAYPETKK